MSVKGVKKESQPHFLTVGPPPPIFLGKFTPMLKSIVFKKICVIIDNTLKFSGQCSTAVKCAKSCFRFN